MFRASTPLATAELERVQAEIEVVAAELEACRARYLDPARQPLPWEAAEALGTYRRLHERIAAVLASLLEAAEPSR